MSPAAVERRPTGRAAEFWLLLFAVAITLAAFALVNYNRDGSLPANWWMPTAIWAGLLGASHIFIRWRAKYADPVILPCVGLLGGIGLAMQYRLDLAANTNVVRTQLIAMAVGVAALIAIVVWLRDYRVLQRYTFVLAIVGLGLLFMPLLPGIGATINGSRIWLNLFGYSFQPAEVAKIVLTLAFASYLADRSEMLTGAGKKLGPITLPRLRDIVPLFAMFAAGILVLVFQSDFGTAMLFFGLFVMMMYVATDQKLYVIGGLVAFAAAAILVFQHAGHIQVRIDSWLHPFSNLDQNGQIIEGQFGMAWGGLFGRGWGLGSPWRIPLVSSDFISAAIGEELGLVGLVAVLVIYTFIVARGIKTALMARDSFGKLLVCGLSFVIVLQVTAIVGGVTRLLPLTGLTTPFLSRGGSSLIANWVMMAIIIVVSHQARRPVVEFQPFVDLETEPTAAIDLAGLLEGGIGPRVSAPEQGDDT